MTSAEAGKQLPRRVVIWRSKLNPVWKLILLAMDENSGSTYGALKASLPRIAAWSGVHVRTVQRAIHGYSLDECKPTAADLQRIMSERKVTRKRAHKIFCAEYTIHLRKEWRHGNKQVNYEPGMLDLHILIQRGKGNWAEHQAAAYELNVQALKECPRVREFLDQDRQRVLPGFADPAGPGHPVYPQKEVRPIFAPGDSLPPGVFLQKNAGDSAPSPGARVPSPGDAVPPGPHGSTPPAPGDCLPPPGGGMSYEPMSSLEGSFRVLDLSVSRDSESSTSTTALPFLQELKTGIREILASMDDPAIERLWQRCRQNAPDCTEDEVLYFANLKSSACFSPKVENPTGLLIYATAQCFEGETMLAELREKRRKQEAARKAKKQAADEEAAKIREELKKSEQESRTTPTLTDDWQEKTRLLRARQREKEEALNQLPADRFQTLHEQAEGLVRAQYSKASPQLFGPKSYEELVRTFMVKILFPES